MAGSFGRFETKVGQKIKKRRPNEISVAFKCDSDEIIHVGNGEVIAALAFCGASAASPRVVGAWSWGKLSPCNPRQCIRSPLRAKHCGAVPKRVHKIEKIFAFPSNGQIGYIPRTNTPVPIIP